MQGTHKDSSGVNGTQILGSPGTGRNTAGVACRRWIASEPEHCVGAFLRVAAMRHTRIARGKRLDGEAGGEVQWDEVRDGARWDETGQKTGRERNEGQRKGEWDTREEWERRGRERERERKRARRFIALRKEERRAHTRRCRTCRRTMLGIQAEGWAAN